MILLAKSNEFLLAMILFANSNELLLAMILLANSLPRSIPLVTLVSTLSTLCPVEPARSAGPTLSNSWPLNVPLDFNSSRCLWRRGKSKELAAAAGLRAFLIRAISVLSFLNCKFGRLEGHLEQVPYVRAIWRAQL